MRKKITQNISNEVGERAKYTNAEIIFVAIEGMPIEDVAWGSEIYRNAVDHGIGTQLKIWDHSSR